jgi:type II secretory pathway pseudopilin PulG
MKKTRNSESGLTLIELIISIALIAMILIAFLPMFIMSAETNTKSETTLDSTYLGKDAMEMAYDLSKNKEIFYEDLDNVLVDEKGYSKESNNAYSFEYSDKKYLYIIFDKEDNTNLVRVVVKIYKNNSMNQLEAQYETLYSWLEGVS